MRFRLASLGGVAGVVACSADGEVRSWGATTSRALSSGATRGGGGAQRALGDFALLGHLDAGFGRIGEALTQHRFTRCALVPARRRKRLVRAEIFVHLQELVLGSFTGAVEIWPVPRDDVAADFGSETDFAAPASHEPKAAATPLYAATLHSSQVVAVAATAQPATWGGTTTTTRDRASRAVAVLSCAADGLVRWVLDTEGLWPLERFSLQRPPASVGLLPPAGGVKFWRVCAATASHVAALCERDERDLFTRERRGQRSHLQLRLAQATQQQQQQQPEKTARVMDLDADFRKAARFEKCETDLSRRGDDHEGSTPKVLGGRVATTRPVDKAHAKRLEQAEASAEKARRANERKSQNRAASRAKRRRGRFGFYFFQILVYQSREPVCLIRTSTCVLREPQDTCAYHLRGSRSYLFRDSRVSLERPLSKPTRIIP